MNLKLAGEVGVDYDDWRECHNPACGAHFAPDTATRYHCSEACAAACLTARLAFWQRVAPELKLGK